jgi:Ankyrin repeat
VRGLLLAAALPPPSLYGWGTSNGQTPLSWATENGYAAVMEMLLAQDGVDLNSRDQSRRTPLS